MTRALRIAERPLILELLRQLNSIFLESFDVLSSEERKEVGDTVKSYTVWTHGSCIQVKDNVVSSFKQLVAKLNEAAFKSIYRRIYDWAYAGDSGVSHWQSYFVRASLFSSVDIRKKVIFNYLYASLLDYFKVSYFTRVVFFFLISLTTGQALMTPYTSFLLPPLTHDLKAFSKAKLQDKDYWIAMLDVITKSLSHDDGGQKPVFQPFRCFTTAHSILAG